jgi:hypothetical protein
MGKILKEKKKVVYSSKGERPIIDRSVLKAVKRDRTLIQKMIHVNYVRYSGKSIWSLEPNTDIETNRREPFKRVKLDPIKKKLFSMVPTEETA